MRTTSRYVQSSIRRIVLITAVAATGLAASGCDHASGQGGRIANPLTPSPPATHALRGVVTDTAGVPLAGAKVTGYFGPGMTNSAFTPVLTAADGSFEATAVASTVMVEVSKDGYSAASKTVTLPATELAFRLSRFPGTTLVFTASPSCSLYAEAKSRRYAVEVQDRDGVIVVRVLDAQGIPYAADLGFAGVRDGSRVTFTLVDDPFRGEWAFVELMPQWEFALAGTASGTMSEHGVSMTFDGRVQVRSWQNTSTFSECTASDHRLEIVR